MTMKSDKGKKPRATIISHLPVMLIKSFFKTKETGRREMMMIWKMMRDGCEGYKKGAKPAAAKNPAMMMTMMMLAKMNQMSGKNLKKKRSGILTSMSLTFLHPRIKRVPELLPVEKRQGRGR